MHKILAVLKREFMTRVKRRSFILWTLLGPLLLIGVYTLPVLFLSLSSTDRHLAVADMGGKILPGFVQTLKDDGRYFEEGVEEEAETQGGFSLAKTRFRITDTTNPGETAGQARERLNAAVGREDFDAYMIIGTDPTKENFILYGSRSSGEVPDEVEDALRDPVMVERARVKQLDIQPEEIRDLAARVDVTPIRVNKNGLETSEGEGQQAVVMGAVVAMAFVFYIVFLIWGSTILRGIAEEKSARITEVMMSSITPTQFMLGKVSGIGLVAIAQLVVWVGSAIALTLVSSATLPQLAELLSAVQPSLFIWFMVLFILGFAMYAVIYAAVGSMVTSTQEAEQAAMPVTFLIVASFFAMFAVQKAPDSTFAVVASMFPLTSPLVMLMRLGITNPPLWQIAGCILFLLGAIYGLAWVAARIFRVGILMYGKRATIPEVMKWIRAA